uniref:Suppressor of forked domain-containing protein n=1 Tax=Timspurckia oligopyrenoides TaxID=708627 RepID=A0A7S0ZB71_9RHOD|mmetsp:Transcript_11031/g.19942  ORF Transcript_11031/g.19942 Transcript_11031/m.19942 type:complete len:780 (+) Transcript_11031:49-2388(+)
MGEGVEGGDASAGVSRPKDVWDSDGWSTRMSSLATQPLTESVRESYETFLVFYPTAGRFWRLYAESAVRSNEHDFAIQIYERGIAFAPTSIELWRAYISFAKKVFPSRDDLVALFERSLRAVGFDLSSNTVWVDYIDFLKSWEAQSPQEENTKRDQIRKVYQRAVRSPILNLDNLWREYEAFENQAINKELARGIIAENQPKYFEARAEFRARKNRREGLQLSMLAVPPRGNTKEEEQASLWRKYIDLERANSNALSPEELYLRVDYAYEQALAVLYRYPDMWIDAAQYQIDVDHKSKAESILDRARQALPYSCLVWLFSCNFLELVGKIGAARELYKTLLLLNTKQSSDGTINTVSNSSESIVKEGNSVSEPKPTSTKATAVTITDQQVLPVELLSPSDSHRSSSNRSLIYSFFMRFSRRNDGIESARKVFLQARNDPNIGWELFVTAAFMEHQLNKQTLVAENIFELGMKKFSTCIPFVLEYIQFLWNCNEEQKLRVFFDRILDTLPRNDVRLVAVWEKYVQFEQAYGDLEAVSNAMRRQAEALAPIPDGKKKSRSSAPKEDEKDLSVFLPSAVDAALSQCSLFGLQPVNEDEHAEILLRRSEVEGGVRSAPARVVGSSAQSKRDQKSAQKSGGADTVVQGPPEKLKLEEGLARMVAALPATVHGQPAPDLNLVIQLIRNTPALFIETPAGRKAAEEASAVGDRGRKGKRKSGEESDDDGEDNDEKDESGEKNENVKRMKTENENDDTTSRAWSARAEAPAIDVFRQRQALKHNKLR